MMTFQGENIWIIGASSGIGLELAKLLSRQGANLALSARRKDELEKIEGGHHIFPLDVADGDELLRTAKAVKECMGKIDRIIFMAAIYAPTALDSLDLKQTKAMFEVNVLGAFHLIHAIIPILKAQNHGQIALCGSVAGYIGLPKGQPYSATKAAIMNLTESLRAEMPASIDVKLISPGFVATPMTAKNNFTMPMIITSEEAAIAIAKGLKKRAFEIDFPKKFTFILKLMRLLPYFITSKLIK